MYVAVPEIIALFSGLPRLQLLLFCVCVCVCVCWEGGGGGGGEGGFFITHSYTASDQKLETRLDRNHPLYIFTAQ